MISKIELAEFIKGNDGICNTHCFDCPVYAKEWLHQRQAHAVECGACLDEDIKNQIMYARVKRIRWATEYIQTVEKLKYLEGL